MKKASVTATVIVVLAVLTVLLTLCVGAWYVWPTWRAWCERPASSMTLGEVVLIAVLAVAFLRRRN